MSQTEKIDLLERNTNTHHNNNTIKSDGGFSHSKPLQKLREEQNLIQKLSTFFT